MFLTGFPIDTVSIMLPFSQVPAASPLLKDRSIRKSFASSQGADATDMQLVRPRTHREFTGPMSTVHTIVRIAIPGFSLTQKNGEKEKKGTKYCYINTTAYTYVEFFQFYYTSCMTTSHLISPSKNGL